MSAKVVIDIDKLEQQQNDILACTKENSSLLNYNRNYKLFKPENALLNVGRFSLYSPSISIPLKYASIKDGRYNICSVLFPLCCLYKAAL